MQLIKRNDFTEGEIIPTDAYVVYGKAFSRNAKNGWKVVLNLRFIRKRIPNWMDPTDFREKNTLCYLRMMIMRRTALGRIRPEFFFRKVWDKL